MKRTFSKGFTIIELLVVITIIAIFATVVGLSLNTGGSGVGVEAASRFSGSLFQTARSQAVLKQTRARVILHADSSDSEKYLRFIGIIYEDPDNPNNWIAANEGEFFSSGVYFDEEASDSRPKMTIEFPLATPQAEGAGSSYFYWEYAPNGQPVDAGEIFVIASGTIIDVDEPPTMDENSRSGFMILRTGGVTYAKNPEDLAP